MLGNLGKADLTPWQGKFDGPMNCGEVPGWKVLF